MMILIAKNDLATDSFEEAIETIEQGLIGPSESSSSTAFRKFSWRTNAFEVWQFFFKIESDDGPMME